VNHREVDVAEGDITRRRASDSMHLTRIDDFRIVNISFFIAAMLSARHRRSSTASAAVNI
jgi:hypothetical protein